MSASCGGYGRTMLGPILRAQAAFSGEGGQASALGPEGVQGEAGAWSGLASSGRTWIGRNGLCVVGAAALSAG